MKLYQYTFATLLALLIAGVCSGASTVFAFNEEINYQGKLLDSSGSAVADGTYHMRFRLYDAASGGTELWEGDRSLLPGNRVPVTSGLFSVLLGSSSPLSGVDFTQTLYLEVAIGGTASSSWETLTPRKRIGAVPAAFEAGNAQTIGGIATSSLLRSDQSDSFTAGTLTFDPGTTLQVNGAGVFGSATATDLYATTLGINSEYFTNLLGAGLINDAGSLAVSSSSLNLTLDGLADTDLASLAQFEILYWDGANWVNAATSSWDTVDDAVDGSELDNLFSSNGFLTRTGANAYTSRTLQGTSDRIVVTNADGVSGNPTLDIATTYSGQSSIDTLGTITTGTWQGTEIGPTYGGTGLTSVTEDELLIGGAGNTWTQVGTSSLGLGDGTFLGLSDTPGSYTSNAIPFVGGGNSLNFDSDLTWNGSNLSVRDVSGLYTAFTGSELFDVRRRVNSTAGGINYAANFQTSGQPTSDAPSTGYYGLGTLAEIRGSNAGSFAGGLSSLALLSSGAQANILMGVAANTYIDGSGTASTGISFYADNPASNSTGGSMDEWVGLYVNATTSFAATNYAIYTDGLAPTYLGGSLGIGTSTPSSKLSVWGSGNSDLLTVATTSGATTTYAMHIDQGGDVYLGTTTRPSFAETAKLVVAEGGVVNTPPAAPQEVGTIVDGAGATGLNGAISVTVAGRYAYVAGRNDDALAIIDVSDPTNPEEVGVICDSGSGSCS
ncbi:hypothetical protein GVX82_04005, partial [Patescibacteria group bacterium]|nr:hypothetical protein [Patescibacteria group bacterium]